MNPDTSLQTGSSASVGRLPDFLILGAQKSGTTSLSSYLNTHPQLQRSNIKELHYFDRCIDQGRSIDWYRSQFCVARGSDTLCFEATPSYLPQYNVAQRVAEALPDAKFIVILREPVERAISHYQMNRNANFKFETPEFPILLDQNIRQLNATMGSESMLRDKPKILRNPVGRGLYAIQLKNWFRHFSQKRFQIIGFRDLVERPGWVCRKVCHHLGVTERELGNNGHQVSNRGNYLHPVSEDDKDRLARFYEKPNRDLVDLLGYQVNW